MKTTPSSSRPWRRHGTPTPPPRNRRPTRPSSTRIGSTSRGGRAGSSSKQCESQLKEEMMIVKRVGISGSRCGTLTRFYRFQRSSRPGWCWTIPSRTSSFAGRGGERARIAWGICSIRCRREGLVKLISWLSRQLRFGYLFEKSEFSHSSWIFI